MDGKEQLELEILGHMRLAVLADADHRYDEREEHINQALVIMDDILLTEGIEKHDRNV